MIIESVKRDMVVALVGFLLTSDKGVSLSFRARFASWEGGSCDRKANKDVTELLIFDRKSPPPSSSPMLLFPPFPSTFFSHELIDLGIFSTRGFFNSVVEILIFFVFFSRCRKKESWHSDNAVSYLESPMGVWLIYMCSLSRLWLLLLYIILLTSRQH